MSRTIVAVLVALHALAVLAVTAAAQTETFIHPLGFSFRHPAGWQVQQSPQGILILPADAAQDAAGNALEVLALGSQPAPGIAGPDDPQVIAHFVENAGGMRRVGAVETVASGLGAGVVLTFEGTVNGIDARRRIYVTLHEGEAVYLLHEARKDLAAQRDAAARALFASLAYSRPANDPQVVGQWRRSSTTGSRDYSGGGIYANDTEIAVLHPDGTIEYGVSTTISGSTSGVSIFREGDPNVQRGRYTAAGGQLSISWQGGGREVFEYSVFLHEGVPHLKFQTPGDSPRYYRKVN